MLVPEPLQIFTITATPKAIEVLKREAPGIAYHYWVANPSTNRAITLLLSEEDTDSVCILKPKKGVKIGPFYPAKVLRLATDDGEVVGVKVTCFRESCIHAVGPMSVEWFDC